MIFGLEWKNERAPEYMLRMQEKLRMPETGDPKDLALGFLRGRVERVNDLWLVEITPAVPPFFMFPVFVMLGMFVFGLTMVWPYIVLSGITVFGALWWSVEWYVIILRWGYKKQTGEKAVVRLVRQNEALRRVLGWDR